MTHPTFTPEEFRAARLSLVNKADTRNISLAEMAELLGYSGKNMNLMQRDLENGRREVRPAQARLMQAYLDGYRPEGWPE